MKQIPIQLQGHYDGYATTTCLLIRIRRTDGQTYGLTDADHDISYNAAPPGEGLPGDDFGLMNHVSANGGGSMSKLEAAADLSVNNGEILTVPNEDITTRMLMNGDFDGAEVYIYRINYMDLTQGHELVDYGLADAARISDSKGVLAFRSQSDLLKEPQSELWSKGCDHRLGGPFCPKEFVWAEGTVTAVSGSEGTRIFSVSFSPADDFYKFGVAQFLDGDNAGREMEIDQNIGSTIVLSLDMDMAIQVGDGVKLRQDCSKVYDDDEHGCLYHWGAADRNLYYGGCPDIPTADGGSSMIPGNGLSRDDD